MQRHLDWMRLRNLTPRTISARRDAIRRLARHLGCDVDDLPAVLPDDLDRWQRDLADLTARYRLDYSGQVRRFYAWCVTTGLCRTDPTCILVDIKTARGLPRPISEADLTMALELVTGRVRPWLVLAAFAGLRAGEIAALTREDMQDRATEPVLRVLGKGGRERIVPLSGYVAAELLAYPLPSRGPLFPRRDGRPGHVTGQLVSSRSNRALHSVGIPDTLHSLRHRFGTRCYAVSRDIRVTQELMGHSSPATTAIYVQWCRAEARNAVEAIADKPTASCGIQGARG